MIAVHPDKGKIIGNKRYDMQIKNGTELTVDSLSIKPLKQSGRSSCDAILVRLVMTAFCHYLTSPSPHLWKM